jgi:hypothetical protein
MILCCQRLIVVLLLRDEAGDAAASDVTMSLLWSVVDGLVLVAEVAQISEMGNLILFEYSTCTLVLCMHTAALDEECGKRGIPLLPACEKPVAS